VIIWLNGTFGAGKTTTAKELAALLPESRIFDPKRLGSCSATSSLPRPSETSRTPPWRGLVVAAAVQILDYVAACSSSPSQFLSISTGVRSAAGSRVPASHCATSFSTPAGTNSCGASESDNEKPNSPWRLDHLDDYEDARAWHSQEASVIDTSGLPPPQVAALSRFT